MAKRQRLYSWISALFGFLFACVLLEGASILWLYIEEGRYLPATAYFERTQNTYVRDLQRGGGCRYVDTLYPHPYVGFVHHANPPCGPRNVNNVGLFNEDFPSVKRTDRYVVLMVGGSVASQLAQNYPSPPAPRFLEEELNAKYISPNGKPFLVLNGGDGAWKQPQQFILFSMYATAVDAMVSVEGYNEHYFFTPWMNERFERPLSNFLEVNPFVADENFGDAAIGWVMGRIAGTLAANPVLGRSHAAYLVVRGIEAAAKSKDNFISGKKTTLNTIFAMPKEIRADNEKAFVFQMELYQKYVRGMEMMAREFGVKSAFFMQPVPAIGKTLTAEEKAVIGDLYYTALYRRMVDDMLKLRERGVPVFDLTDLLVDEKRTIYEDGIHFFREKSGESIGYRIMAARVAKDLAATWKLQPK
jgi:hypothetical protein